MKRYLIIFLIPLFALAQTPTKIPTRERGATPTNNQQQDQQPESKLLEVSGEKPPITDYLIISQDRDTTYVDTTLSMVKDYKFNYLRKDDFELMPLHNVGRPYNELGKSSDLDVLMPSIGAQGRQIAYLGIDDIYDYHVPTPLTELYFRTAINQGQQLDAFFANNISPGFNFTIGYKGIRSAGDYVNTLTSTGIFKFTSSYVSKSERYRMRLHTIFHQLEQQENAGLDPASLQGFIDGDDDFNDRGRLEPNTDDAISMLDGKRIYIDHDYELIGHKDSTSYASLRLYNTMFFEDQFYRYDESSASNQYYGESFTTSGLKDQSDLEQGKIEVGASFDHHILGYFKAGLARQAYNYGYDRVINLSNGDQITNRLVGELYQFNGSFEKRIGAFDVKANTGINIAGDLTGQFINGTASYQLKDATVNAGLEISSRAPDFNYLLFQSDYVNYNWQNSFNNIETQRLSFNIESDKWIDASVSLTTIQDHVYFSQQEVTEDDGSGGVTVTGFNATPVQFEEDIAYLKVKLHKDVKIWRNFGLDNTIMYQSVAQNQDVFNVPDLTVRHSLYYKDELFKKALKLQTGITVKYFTEYYMDAYDPVLGSFITQNTDELGGFPMVDFFVNAKIRQTRIFFKLEHLNQLIASGDNYFSAPRMPYRDFSLRFGIVWNFFL